MAADVAAARGKADYVIVSFHWGREASTTVQAYQRDTAHRAIDAGADVVIGHHPHVLQGVERYRRGIIFYSLGNFAFASTSTIADVFALVRLRLTGRQRQGRTAAGRAAPAGQVPATPVERGAGSRRDQQDQPAVAPFQDRDT